MGAKFHHHIHLDDLRGKSPDFDPDSKRKGTASKAKVQPCFETIEGPAAGPMRQPGGRISQAIIS